MSGIVSEVGRCDPTLSGTLEQQQRAVEMNRVATRVAVSTTSCVKKGMEVCSCMFLLGSIRYLSGPTLPATWPDKCAHLDNHKRAV